MFTAFGVVLYKIVFAGNQLFDPIYIGVLTLCLGVSGQLRVLVDKFEELHGED